MRLKKAIKRIAALGVGAAFLGATLGSAMALDLADYPSPFIDTGRFSGVLVVGDKAAAEDVIGVTDIATSLQYSSTTSTGTTSGVTTTVEGDAFKISKAGDDLNMYEHLSSASGPNDLSQGPIETLTSSDLNALADGSITNEHGTYSYDQILSIATNATVTYAVDADQSDDPAIYLYFPTDKTVYTYKISFPKAVKSDCDADGDWDDLDNKKVTMLGKEYTVVNTNNNTGKIDLMSGAIQETLQEGETKTFTINDKEYEVNVPIITDTGTIYVKFVVNGETTDKMVATDTFKLADGVEIGVKEVLPNEAGDVSQDMVEFYLGASKVSFIDSNIAGGSPGTLEVGGEEVDDVTLDLVGSNNAQCIASGTGSYSLSKIEAQLNASDDYYVPVGEKLSGQLPDDEKEKLFLQNLDYEFAAFNTGETETIKLAPAATNSYRLTMPTKTDGEISFYAFYSATGINVSLGKSSTRQLVGTGGQAGEHDFFAVSSSKYSHLIEVVDVTSSSSATKVKVKPVGGTTITVENSTGTTTDFYLDGFKYQYKANAGGKFIIITDDGTDNCGENGSMQGDLETGASIALYTDSEAWVNISLNHAVNGGVAYNRSGFMDNGQNPGMEGLLQFKEYHKGPEDGASTNVKTINASVYDRDGTGTTYKIDVVDAPVSDDRKSFSQASFSFNSWDSKTNYKTEYTRWGTFVEFTTPSDGQNTLEITYPKKEATADVYITSGVTKILQAGEAGAEAVTIAKIEVGATKLASEVTDVTAQNIIAVGGPCANAVAAEVMGDPADCTAGFEAGKGRLLLYENGENVAMIVAGYGAIDTRNAAQVVANYGDYALAGTAMEVSKVGTTLTVAEETAVVEEAAEETAEEETTEETA